MTAITATAPVAAHRPAGRRVWDIVRLHFANPATVVWTPLMILAIIFAANYAIWVIINRATAGDQEAVQDVSQGLQFSGASAFIFVYMLVVAVQAMNFTFPLALGFGSTRRDFYLGSALTFLLLSVGYSVLYTLLSMIEKWTNGWGINGAMFNTVYFGSAGDLSQLYFVFVTFVFFFFVGTVAGSAYVRAKQYGVIAFFAVVGVVLIGGLALITFTESWVQVGEFFVSIGWFGGFSLLWIPAAVSAVLGYFILRRATPRS